MEEGSVSVQALQRLQGRSILLPKDPIGDVDLEVRVDADELRVECGVMRLCERNLRRFVDASAG
jgi:hypothetical protein